VEITDAVAHFLAHHDGSLSLSPPHGICDYHLASLITHAGPLTLGGIKKLERRTATILAGQQGKQGSPGLSGLFLDDVEHVTPPVAAILATHRAGVLSLNGIPLLSEDAARELVGHPFLNLDGVTSMTDRVADILASHAGGAISLRGLRHVSPSGLTRLRQNLGIELPHHFRDDPPPPTAATAAAPPAPSRAEMIAIIERIAREGEHTLRDWL